MKKLLIFPLTLLAWSLPTKTTSCTTKVFDVLVNICCKEEVVAGYYKKKLEKQILEKAPRIMARKYAQKISSIDDMQESLIDLKSLKIYNKGIARIENRLLYAEKDRLSLLDKMAKITLSPEKFEKYNYVKDKW